MNVLPLAEEDRMAAAAGRDCAAHGVRIDRLEEDVRELRGLPKELALVRQSLDGLRTDLAARHVALSRSEVETIVREHTGTSWFKLFAGAGFPSSLVGILAYYAAAVATGTPPVPPPAMPSPGVDVQEPTP